MLQAYFQLGPISSNAMYGTYDWRLVLLSYLVATFASYIALDMTGRLRDENNTLAVSFYWLVGGAIAMGAGIWSMHFIGMLAFQLAMPMTYNSFWTAISMLVAIVASLIALSLLMGKKLRRIHLIMGGFILGIAIAAMHYTGMYAMTDSMIIRYIPSIFMASIVIAIVAAEAALWLAIKSNQGLLRHKIRLKVASALIMGAAICGMHYTGMAAAVFFPKPNMEMHAIILNPEMLAISIAGVTFLILGIAFALSTYKEIANQQNITTARLAGMAEVSSNVLHSVGNVLNSLNVSATSIVEQIEHTKISELSSLSHLFKEHENNLIEFIQENPKGKQLPDYVHALADYWKNQRAEILTELRSLLSNIQHIRDIISTQQSLRTFTILEQVIDARTVIDEAITITGITLIAHLIQIKKDFSPIKPFLIDKVKLLQILVNLIRNAKDSLMSVDREDKVIFIRLEKADKKTIAISIIDNGAGITKENINKIFTHGFSTKESGHGYGLHSSSILAKQMGGVLTCESEGKGQGATFRLMLPYKF